MRSLVTLKRIRVENANAVAGLTYGFPAISHFLGFTHALSRKVKGLYDVELNGCAVICHSHQVKTQKLAGWGDSVFSLSRNPLTKEGKTAPFNEEGKMHMEVSLLIECAGYLPPQKSLQLRDYLIQIVPNFRIAGGIITTNISDGHVSVESFPDQPKDHRRKLYSLLPGFLLRDRSEKVREHFQQMQKKTADIEFIDAWLDFCALKFKPVAHADEATDEQTSAEWEFHPKPVNGWLVPITTGYKAISSLYSPGDVANSRDVETPFRFVEAAYGIGEWVSPHRINNIEDTFWRYHYEGDWYLCQQISSAQI